MPNLTSPAQFNTIPRGKPSFGRDPKDPKIWYYDGTPTVCTFFALDYVVPNFWNGKQPDLFVNGPNFGTNIGEFMYAFSGTMAATYSAIGRGIPAISISADSYGPSRGYMKLQENTKSGFPDPATIIGNLSTQLVNQLATGVSSNGTKLLPHGYGLSVNFPKITSFKDKSCLYPPFIRTRLSGGAATQKAVFDFKTGTFTGQNIVVPNGINECINGNCTLPGESTVVNNYCQTSVSVFTINYDAPSNAATKGVDASLAGVVVDEAHARNYSAATVGSPPPVEQVGQKQGANSVRSAAGRLCAGEWTVIGTALGLALWVILS
jgi:5'-nucleotidase